MHLLIQLSKTFFLILILLYVWEAYAYFRKKTENGRKKVLRRQIVVIMMMVVFGFAMIYVHDPDIQVLILGGSVAAFFAAVLILYRIFYRKASMMLVNHMLMLLGIGFIMITRLDFDKARKQFLIAAAAYLAAFLIPVIIRKLTFLQNLSLVYAVVGLLALSAVFVLAAISGGAKLSLTVGGISIQFSEIVKITLVFFLASYLYQDRSFKRVAIATVVAAIHVILLVLSTDLGSAAVFFVAYLVMIYAATGKPVYPLAALGGGSLAAVGAYFVFNHVKNRVIAWRDPFAVYDGAGYQVVQGLFGIGAGGWFGTGLGEVSPASIPVAAKDYIFAAICEEFGGIFGICLILLCMSLFLLIIDLAFEIRKPFYRLIALGLGSEYAFQVFLTIGGVTKFIPLTGITLPLVSYGGSSVMSTIIMLAIVQGLYMLREDEEAAIEKD